MNVRAFGKTRAAIRNLFQARFAQTTRRRQACLKKLGQTGTQGASASSGDPYNTNGDAVKERAKQTGQEGAFNEIPQELLEWLGSLEGSSFDFDASRGYGLQCFDLFIAYLKELGCSYDLSKFPRPDGHAHAYDIDNFISDNPNMFPGWTVLNNQPSPSEYRVGDILVWDDGEDGHVAIVVAVYPDGSYDYVDYNGGGNNEPGTLHKSTDNWGAHHRYGVADHICRPDYSN